jgi:integration host factor subunit alpha
MQWTLAIIIDWARDDGGVSVRPFTVDVTYSTEAEADLHGIVYGQSIIDGKVPGGVRWPTGKYQMRKVEIAHRMHQAAGIPEEQAATLVDWVLQLFKSTLQQGEPISIAKFGVFTVRSKVPRRGRNPRTGEEIMISPRRVVVFRASTQLKAEIAGIPEVEASKE